MNLAQHTIENFGTFLSNQAHFFFVLSFFQALVHRLCIKAPERAEIRRNVVAVITKVHEAVGTDVRTDISAFIAKLSKNAKNNLRLTAGKRSEQPSYIFRNSTDVCVGKHENMKIVTIMPFIWYSVDIGVELIIANHNSDSDTNTASVIDLAKMMIQR
jgi:hypothetical protein